MSERLTMEQIKLWTAVAASEGLVEAERKFAQWAEEYHVTAEDVRVMALIIGLKQMQAELSDIQDEVMNLREQVRDMGYRNIREAMREVLIERVDDDSY